MSTNHPIRVADAAATVKLDPVMLEAIVKRNVLVLSPSESLIDIVQPVGEIALAVAAGSLGQLFFYDETDTTTPPDGQTCLVDGSGHRYHLEDMATIHVSSVISETNTPPGAPNVGDAYIVGTSPTGAWAAQAKDIAIYTRRGWVYATPLVGMTVLNRAIDENRQYLDTGLWGAFASLPSAGSIAPAALAFPMGLPVEAVQNAPPVSPTEGLYYIVGTSPTGDFSGHANALATYISGSWMFIAAYEGATVYDRANDYEIIYNGGWAGVGASSVQEFTSTAGGTWNKPGKGSIAYIQVWGAGGSGARDGAAAGAGGGGGGSYREMFVPLSSLASTVAVTVGAGGVSRSTNGNGSAGGSSSFGSLLTAYGGGGGAQSDGGGGGGGSEGAGSTASSGTGATGGTGDVGQAGAAAEATSAVNGGGGGGTTGSTGIGGNSVDGGGGGGAGNSTGVGGNSRRGGGGGGGGSGTGNSNAGGTSVLGGAGGAGSVAGLNGADGTQPGGGGGGSRNGTSGKGGDGMVRVTVW